MHPADTIAAIATPPGEGGLAVIRVSGPEALAIVGRCFRPSRAGGELHLVPSHTVHHGHVVCSGEIIDEVLVTVLRSPRTYTREDTVEIGCHAGGIVTRGVLATVLAAGARMAGPGEFTRRAFLNGRLDLAQAEAVADLIHARSELAARAATAQLSGHLSRRIDALRDDLLLVLAHVEAQLDFPDEDIAPETGDALCRRMATARGMLEGLLRTAGEGRVLRQGLRVAIVGSPNAGKSSLLNRLLGEDRAIVAPSAGTTRDTIEESADIRGWPVVFVDTAGLREGSDEVEREGVRRSRQAAGRAEVLLHVVDASQPWQTQDRDLLGEFAGRRRTLVLNKSDLPSRWKNPDGTGEPTVEVSCVTGLGVEALKDRIAAWVGEGIVTGDSAAVAISARHHEALRRADEALGRALQALVEGIPLDFVALEVRVAVDAIGEVVGRTTTEDLLDRIFSTFCLGK